MLVWLGLTRERLVAIGVALVCACAIAIYALRWLETAITFHPVRVVASNRKPTPHNAKDVWFTTADNVRIHGWYFDSSARPAVATIIFFHGNGGNIENVDWVAERLAKRGIDVLLFDYRGYGQSEGEALYEAELYKDGDAAYSYVLNERSVPADKVVLYGQSLGTAVAADVAARQKCGAVILESGLSSASSVATVALPWLPRWLHFLGRNRFDSFAKLREIRVPILVTHGDPDPVIPAAEARLLFEAANEPKKLLVFPGAGHNVFGSIGDRYLDQLEEFVRQSVG